jgi:alpha-glucoside transport system substrate-binding protein
MRHGPPLALLVALVLAACGGSAESPGTSPGSTSPGATVPGVESFPQIGGTVNVISVWAGEEEASFRAMLEPFMQRTGISLEYEATGELSTYLRTRIADGDLPDVAALPSPADTLALAEDGALRDLASALDMDRLRQGYAEDWIDLGTVHDQYVGLVVFAAPQGNIWFVPRAFETNGWDPPRSLEELDALVEQMADTGTPPWCIGLASAEARGWPATDWIEDFVLRRSGPDVYDRWHRGEIKWTSAEIKQAWEAFGRWATDPRYVKGGPEEVLSRGAEEGGDGLFTDPPGCYLHHAASFITELGGFAQKRPGIDYDLFGFPAIDPAFAGAVVSAGDLVGQFSDTPQAAALIQWLASPEAQQIWIERGGKLTANKGVPLEAYPDDVARRSAQILTTAGIVRFDASGLMPPLMQTAFLSGVLDYVRDPTQLDRILADLDDVQADAYD